MSTITKYKPHAQDSLPQTRCGTALDFAQGISVLRQLTISEQTLCTCVTATEQARVKDLPLLEVALVCAHGKHPSQASSL